MELGDALLKRTSLSITAEGGEVVSIYIDTVKALDSEGNSFQVFGRLHTNDEHFSGRCDIEK